MTYVWHYWHKYCNRSYIQSKSPYVFFVFIYIFIQIGLIIDRVFTYKDHNLAVMFARSTGVLLALNMSLVILLVLKRFLTWFGNLKIFRILFPIDHFLAIHKFIGIYIVFLSFIHTIAHCVNQCNFL